jgi:hypothetical protein
MLPKAVRIVEQQGPESNGTRGGRRKQATDVGLRIEPTAYNTAYSVKALQPGCQLRGAVWQAGGLELRSFLAIETMEA